MKRMNLKSALSTALLICGSIVVTSALAQGGPGNGIGSGGMMGGYGGGWMGGGYGGIWLPVLVVIVVAGLVAWIVAQKKK